VDRLVDERDKWEFLNLVVCIRNEFSKEDVTGRVSERAEIAIL